MTTYTVKPEYIDQFGSEANTDYVMDISEIADLARGWNTDIMSVISMCNVHQNNPFDEEQLLSEYGMNAIVNIMDDSIRERVHMECAPCSDEEFIRAYLMYADIVMN